MTKRETNKDEAKASTNKTYGNQQKIYINKKKVTYKLAL